MRFISTALALILMVAAAHAQELSPTDHAKIAVAIEGAVASSGTPSASVGVVEGGKLVYAQALGDAVLPMTLHMSQGAVKADAAMAYPIGSVSKQFTAACILLLQERGKLTLDDPISKWFPVFTRAKDITIRNLLTHTSGYSDYALQDYTIPAWLKPVDNDALVREWATKPLDFEPGTKWQYSNTNYQIAALIIEKVSGQTFHDFMWDNIITPLKLDGVLDLDTDQAKLQVRGYERHALGPLRLAKLESPGWSTGGGNLAMPIRALMQWNDSIMRRTLLQPKSYDAMETDFLLKDGTPSHYGLGLFVRKIDGKHIVSHDGEVGGFVSSNVIDLTDDISYAALTNLEGPSARTVTTALRPILTPDAEAKSTSTANKPATTTQPGDAAATEQAKIILANLQHGKLDRSLFTADANYYFNAETLGDFQSSLKPLRGIKSITQIEEKNRGGMVFREYQVMFVSGVISVNTYTRTDGKLEQFLVTKKN